MKQFYVYAHYTLDTNELFYIGKGKNNRYLDKNQRNRYWDHIVEKHGYRAEILIKNLEESDSLIQELLGIKELSPKANLSKGGIGGFTGLNAGSFKKGHKPWNTGKKRPKQSARQMGKDNPMYGKPSPTRRKVQCENDGKMFDSVEICCNFYKISRGGFYKSQRENKPIKGWSFKYV